MSRALAVLPLHLGHAQEAPDRFAGDQIAIPFRHQRAAQHRLSTGGGELGEHDLLLLVVATGGLVPHFAGRIRRVVVRPVFVNLHQRIASRKLKRAGRITPTCPGAIHAAIVIARQSPLTDAGDGMRCRRELSLMVPHPGVVGVDLVVEIEDEPRRLVLNVTFVLVAFIGHLAPVGDTVLVFVKVGVDGVGVRQIHQHPIPEREHRSRQQDVVDEHRPLVHLSIAIGINQFHHPAHGSELIGRILVLHVGAPFTDVELAIGAKRH